MGTRSVRQRCCIRPVYCAPRCRGQLSPPCEGGVRGGWSASDQPRCQGQLSPPCEGGVRGGWSASDQPRCGQLELGWSQCYQLWDDQSRWMRLSWFINAIFARPVPDCSLTTPPGPPPSQGGESPRGIRRIGATKTGGTQRYCETKFSTAHAHPTCLQEW
jgi:hypothetical protein